MISPTARASQTKFRRKVLPYVTLSRTSQNLPAALWGTFLSPNFSGFLQPPPFSANLVQNLCWNLAQYLQKPACKLSRNLEASTEPSLNPARSFSLGSCSNFWLWELVPNYLRRNASPLKTYCRSPYRRALFAGSMLLTSASPTWKPPPAKQSLPCLASPLTSNPIQDRSSIFPGHTPKPIPDNSFHTGNRFIFHGSWMYGVCSQGMLEISWIWFWVI